MKFWQRAFANEAVQEPHQPCQTKKAMKQKKFNYFLIVFYYSHVIITQFNVTSVSSPTW